MRLGNPGGSEPQPRLVGSNEERSIVGAAGTKKQRAVGRRMADWATNANNHQMQLGSPGGSEPQTRLVGNSKERSTVGAAGTWKHEGGCTPIK